MTPAYFWKCTPRKFDALCKVHADLNAPSAKEGKKKKSDLPTSDSVGKPDSFIDNLPFFS